VVPNIDAENVLELTAADDQHPVEALAADAADPALDMCVRVRRLHGACDERPNRDAASTRGGTKALYEATQSQVPALVVAAQAFLLQVLTSDGVGWAAAVFITLAGVITCARLVFRLFAHVIAQRQGTEFLVER
jgi:hypothetical protein